MRLHRMLGRFAVAAILLLGAGTVHAKKVDPEDFRQRLMLWALESDKAYGTGEELADKLAVLSKEQVEYFISAIDNPEAFLAAIDQEVRWLADQRSGKGLAQAGRQEAQPSFAPSSSPALTTLTPFPPGYPPDSGGYKTWILDAITILGVPVSSTERCGTNEWANKVAVWFPLWKASDAAEASCIVAGCDPSGFVCGWVCGIYEAAKLAVKVAATPIEACSIHDAAIDGAEIEATHKNVLTLLGSVAVTRVHLQVIELVERKKYLVLATEAGEPVDVEFTAIQSFDEGRVSFEDIPAASVTTVEPGTYVVRLNLNARCSDKVFRLRVTHDDVVDHFGEAVFNRTASRGVATGQ